MIVYMRLLYKTVKGKSLERGVVTRYRSLDYTNPNIPSIHVTGIVK